jgi:hypothetical protein
VEISDADALAKAKLKEKKSIERIFLIIVYEYT